MSRKKKNQKEKIDIFANVPSIIDKVLPDCLEEKKDYLYLGYNKYCRCFVMTIYPEMSWIGWLQDLYYIGNVNISIKVESSSNATVINQLTRKLVQAQSQYTTYAKQGNIAHTPELEKQISDLEDLRTLIQTNQDKLFFVTIFISITCEDLQTLNEKSKILEAEINKKTAMIRTLSFRQIEGLKNILPLGEIAIPNYERNMLSRWCIDFDTYC